MDKNALLEAVAPRPEEPDPANLKLAAQQAFQEYFSKRQAASEFYQSQIEDANADLEETDEEEAEDDDDFA